MALKGDLSTVGLAEVFQMISMSQKQGTLVVQDGESRKAIYFGQEGVSLLSTGKRKGFRIGDLLLKAGKITEEQLAEVLARQKASKRKLGEELVASGLITDQDINDAVRSQIEEEIYDLFLWKKAAFEFIEGDPVEELKDPNVIRLSFDLNGLLLEAVRRTDEWTRINQKIPSLDQIYAFVDDAGKHEVEKDERGRILGRYLDGQSTIHDMVEGTILPRFDICNTLVEMIDKGRIRPLNTEEIVQLARRRLEEGKRERGLALFQAAANQSPDDANLLDSYAHSLETEGLIPDAAKIYLRVGQVLKDRGQGKESVAYFQRALALAPNDQASKEALFEINLAQGNVEEAIQAVKELVAASLKSKDFTRARAVGEMAVQTAPQNLEVRLALARVYHGLNLKELRDEQIQFIQKNLPVDQAAADRIQIELSEISEMAPRLKLSPTTGGPAKKRKRAGPRLGVAAAALGVGLVGAGIYYEFKASSEYEAVEARARDLEKQGKLAEARDHITTWRQGPWGYSLLLKGRISGHLESIDNRIRDLARPDPLRPTPTPSLTPAQIEEAKREAERRRRLKELENLESSMDIAFQHGEFDNAQRIARELASLAEALGDAGRTKKARDLEARLTDYLKHAWNLKSEFTQLEKEGRYAEAAERAEELLRKYQHSEAVKGVTIPLCLRVFPAGVQVLRDDQPVTLTTGADFLIRLGVNEKPFKLSFVRKGFKVRTVDVSNTRLGLLQVRLDERETEWKFPVGAEFEAPPIVDGDVVYLRTPEKVFALGTQNRILKWDVKLESAPGTGMRLAAGKLLVPSGKSLVGVDPAKEGDNVLFRVKFEAAVVGTPGVSADGKTAYVGTADRQLHAVNLESREILWHRSFPREIQGEPLDRAGTLLVACGDGVLYAIRGPEETAWSVRTGGELAGAPGGGPDVYFLGSHDGRVTCFEGENGNVKWTSAPLGSAVQATPVRQGHQVYAPTASGHLVALDAESGVVKWSAPSGGELRSPAAYAGSLVFFGSGDGWLHAVDSATGVLQWKGQTARRIRLAPVVAGGRVWYGSDDQVLYSLPLD